jgi:hypothetical protein
VKGKGEESDSPLSVPPDECLSSSGWAKSPAVVTSSLPPSDKAPEDRNLTKLVVLVV